LAEEYSAFSNLLFIGSMASTVFYYFSCGSGSDVAGWILGSILFVLGIVYFILHCCGGEGYKREIKEQMM
jgi:hypothetical protein